MTERIVWTTFKAQLFRVMDYTGHAKYRNVKKKKGKVVYQALEKCMPDLGFEVHPNSKLRTHACVTFLTMCVYHVLLSAAQLASHMSNLLVHTLFGISLGI